MIKDWFKGVTIGLVIVATFALEVGIWSWISDCKAAPSHSIEESHLRMTSP